VTPLTRAEHEALGVELHDIRRRLLHLSTELGNRYGRSKTPYRRVNAAYRGVAGLCGAMDDQFAQDCPDDFDPTVYHPGKR